MRLGVTDMIGLAASLIFALPLANYAIIRLFAGEVALGVGLLVVAVAMVALPQYFLDPGRLLRELLAGLLPRQLRGLVASPETEDDADADPDDETVTVESESGAPEPRKFAVYTLETVSQERPDRVVNAVPRLLSFIEESASTPDMGDFLAQDDDVPGSDVPMAAENAVREQRLDTADVRAAAGETVARVAEERPHEVSLGSASLEVLLTDDSPAVLRAGTRICDALAGRQPECVFDVLPALVDRLGPKESDETRSSASEAVRTLCEHDRAEVRSVLHDRSDPAFASLRSGPPASLDACRVLRAVLARERQMTDADVSHRSLVDRLGELLADDDPAVRASAALATGQLEVSEDIVELLDPAPSEADATESNERADKRASGEPKDAVAGSSEG